jgi:hypothetical protein
MSLAPSLVRTLFSAPGHVVAHPDTLLAHAASAHADLIARARAEAKPALARSLAPIESYGSGPISPAARHRLFCSPHVIEGLHALAPFSRVLQRWHDGVTSNPIPRPDNPAVIASLGNVALAIRLRKDRHLCGRFELVTDVLGRLGFPFCDWTFLLYSDAGTPLSGQAMALTLDPSRAVWQLGDEPNHDILVMPRRVCDRMLIDNDREIEAGDLIRPDPAIHLRLTCACPLGRSAIRYDPVGIPAGTGHAGVTGGLIARIVAAIRRDSPAIYREFCKYIRTIRGFEFARSASVASFSDPTLPGIMGLSVAYTERDEPCLDPFCFTWFGHEMGHTKDYLCDTVLHSLGESLATNGTEWSDSIPRYGRSLPVRTLIQLPYVHLYEWALLMDFAEAGFEGLPWKVLEGTAAIGNDYAAEIEESFHLIDQWADLSTVGIAAMDYFHELFDEANNRWQALRMTV